jgi:hypothetical protein
MLRHVGVCGAAVCVVSSVALYRTVHPRLQYLFATRRVPRHRTAQRDSAAQYYVALLTDPYVVWAPLPCLSSTPRQAARLFLSMWGPLFMRHRHGMGWWFVVGIVSTVAAGVVGSFEPRDGAGCAGQQWAVLVLSVLTCCGAVVLHPFASATKHWLSVAMEVAGVVSAACAVGGSVTGVAVTARVQLYLGCVSPALTISRRLLDKMYPTTSSDTTLSQMCKEEDERHNDAVAHYVLVHSYPPQHRLQVQERLESVVTLITERQRKQECVTPSIENGQSRTDMHVGIPLFHRLKNSFAVSEDQLRKDFRTLLLV